MTGHIVIYIMVAMGSCKNNEKVKEKIDKELSHLRKSFTTLNIDYKKGILKTAQELLKIQKANKEMAGDGIGYSVFSKCKNG